MRGRPIDDETKQKIRNAYGRNVPIDAIKRNYGVSKSSIYNIVRRHRGRPPHNFGKEKLDVIATGCVRGHTDARIAREAGVHPTTVGRHRKRMGLYVPVEDRKREW